MKLNPLIRPLYARAKAFHSDPSWAEPRIRARLAQFETPQERRLVELMEAAKLGHVDQLAEVIGLMQQQQDDSFWARASLLLSYAAPSSVLRALPAAFAADIRDRKDPVVQCFVAETLLNSGLLWTVPEALSIMLLQVDRSGMFPIPTRLSLLLEPAPGEVSLGPNEIPEPGPWPDWYTPEFTHDDASYERLVLEVYRARLNDVGGDDGAALFQGKPIEIKRIAHDLLMTLGRIEDGEVVSRLRMILEARTGVDMSGFFREDLVLDRPGAMQAVERLFDTVDLGGFRIGARSFFGRLLA